jgi:transcriptional regulator with XRE-family HTH domain
MNSKSSPLPQPVVAYPSLIGKVILQRRELCGTTQAAVAEALGLSQSAYSRLESGDSVINVSQLRSIAQVIGEQPSDLLKRADRYELRLRQQGAEVVSEKKDNSVAIAIGLGLLAAVLLSK